jgi:DNA polymerase-3 subunit delta
MKVATGDQDRFLQSAESKVAAVLFYGADQGLVRERALDLVTRVAGDAADPFRVAELTAAQLKDDPARLADEAAALSLSGGRRVLRLREAADTHAEALDELLAGPPPASFLVLEAGELAPRSALRKVFEGSKAAAAIACYLDDEKVLARLVQDSLKAQGLAIEQRALAYLVANLGGDRGVSRQELEKLALYMGGTASEVTLDDVAAVIGDSSAASLDDCIFAVADGDRAATDRGYARALEDGHDEISILRATARHIMRLHQIASAGEPREAMRSLRPPVFYKFEGRFLAQLRLWSPRRLGEALSRLNRAEIDLKTSAQPKSAIAERALLDIAGLARAGQAKTGARP